MDVSQHANRIALIPAPNEGKTHRNCGRASAREGRDSNRRERFTFNKTARHVHLCICCCSKCDSEGCLKVSSIFHPDFRDSNGPCSFRFLSGRLKISNLDETLKSFVDVSALKSCFKPQTPRKAFLFQSALQRRRFIPADFTEEEKKKQPLFVCSHFRCTWSTQRH